MRELDFFENLQNLAPNFFSQDRLLRYRQNVEYVANDLIGPLHLIFLLYSVRRSHPVIHLLILLNYQ